MTVEKKVCWSCLLELLVTIICLGIPTVPELTTYLYGVTKWKQLAIYLLPPESAPTEIDKISKNCQGDVDECKRQLYSEFLKQGTCTWKKVIEALEKSKHLTIAQSVKAKFCL